MPVRTGCSYRVVFESEDRNHPLQSSLEPVAYLYAETDADAISRYEELIAHILPPDAFAAGLQYRDNSAGRWTTVTSTNIRNKVLRCTRKGTYL